MLAIAVFTTLIFSQHAQAILGSLQIWPQPERTTELFFASPDKLVRTYTPNTSQPIEFTITNKEQRAVTYHYVVNQRASADQPPTLLATGNVQLKPDQSDTQRLDITPIAAPRAPMLEVELTYEQDGTPQKRTISYWLTPKKET